MLFYSILSIAYTHADTHLLRRDINNLLSCPVTICSFVKPEQHSVIIRSVGSKHGKVSEQCRMSSPTVKCPVTSVQ